jgi:hypothetical protein
MSAQLIKQLRERRMTWVDLTLPGKRVRLIRPTEVELSQYFIKDGSVSVGIEEVKRFTIDWQGFTEADLLGAAIGSSDTVQFTPELWAEVVSDHVDWVRDLAHKLLDLSIQHRATAEGDEKNS